jgi:hypothetical protein
MGTKPEETEARAKFLADLFSGWMEGSLKHPERLQRAMQDAVAGYDHLLTRPSTKPEARDFYILVASVDGIGLRVAAALQEAAAVMAKTGQNQLPMDTVVVTSFLLGLLTAAGLMRITDAT